MHGTQYVLLCRLTHRILLVICQDDHIFPLVIEMIVQVRRHILDVVYASSQLSSLPEVIDADKECLTITCAGRVLEIVALRSSLTETLHGLWWRWRGIVITVYKGIGVY